MVRSNKLSVSGLAGSKGDDQYSEFDEMSDFTFNLVSDDRIEPDARQRRTTLAHSFSAALAQVPEETFLHLKTLMMKRSHRFQSNMTNDPGFDEETMNESERISKDVGANWSQELHSRTTFITGDNGKVYATRHGRCSWLRNFLRSILYSDDLFVSVWCAQSKTSEKTKRIHGVAQNALWTSNDQNRLHFFVPHYGRESETGEIPLEIFVQLWDWDSHSPADFVGAKVVNLRPAICQNQRGLALELNYSDEFVGTLFVNLTVVDWDDLSSEQMEELYAIQNEKQKRRRSMFEKLEHEFRDTIFELLTGQLEDIEKHEQDMQCRMIELEILRFEGLKQSKNNFQKSKAGILGVLAFSAWVLFGAGSVAAFEGWNFGRAVYWALVTMTCAGYGDMAPVTSMGRAITCIWIIGCILLTFVLAIEWMRTTIQKRGIERIKNGAIKQWIDSVEYTMNRRVEAAERLFMGDNRTIHLLRMLETHGLNIPQPTKFTDLSGYLVGFWVSLIVVWHSVWCIFFCFFAENTMNFGEALYFGIITSTTVGYGDYSADQHKDAEIFISFTVLFGAMAWINLGSEVSRAIQTHKGRKELKTALQAEVTAQDLRKFARLSTGKENVQEVDRADFLHGMLLHLDLVDPAIIDQINQKFSRNSSANGKISVQEK